MSKLPPHDNSVFDLVDEASDLVRLLLMASGNNGTGDGESYACHAGAKHALALLDEAKSIMCPPLSVAAYSERRVPRGE